MRILKSFKAGWSYASLTETLVSLHGIIKYVDLLSPSRTALQSKSRTFCCIALHTMIQTSTVPREALFVGMYGKNQQSFPLTRSFVQKLVIANFWGRKFLLCKDVMPAILNALFCVEYPILTHNKFDTLNVKVWFHAYGRNSRKDWVTIFLINWNTTF